jgi:hypothetical protein
VTDNDQRDSLPPVLGGSDRYDPFEDMHKTLKDELEASSSPMMVFCVIALGLMALISMVWF